MKLKESVSDQEVEMYILKMKLKVQFPYYWLNDNIFFRILDRYEHMTYLQQVWFSFFF